MESADSHSLLARDYKFFDAARKAACNSDFKIRVGAVAIYKRKIIASASSQNKTHSMQMAYNSRYRDFCQVGMSLPKVHAEIALIAKIKKLDIPMKDVSIYVYRICKSRDHGMARPCEACYAAVRDAGISRVAYTTDYGYAWEVIDKIDKKTG